METNTNSDILKKNMIDALEKSLGIVTTACKSIGISRQTHYRWLGEDDVYKNAVIDISEITLDFAESQLHQQIKNGEVSSTIFYLKTKGKKRGYIERSEVELSSPQGIKISYNADPDCKPIGTNPESDTGILGEPESL